MDLVAHGVTGALIGAALVPAGASGSEATALTLVGAAAGLAPDLDFLFELRGKLAAWRFHRVALHGIPTVAVLAAVLVPLALVTPAGGVGALWTAATVVAALLSHLVLDVLTSFGTALGFPFSRRRYTLRACFIVDPFYLAIAAAGLLRPAAGLAALVFYLGLTFLVRAHCARLAARSLAAAGIATPVRLEPRFLAPLRWLAVATHGQGYALANVTPLGVGPWRKTPAGRGEEQARRQPILSAFLETCESPRFEEVQVEGKRYLLVEDVKWWLELPFRPLAFRAEIGAGGELGEPRQTRLTERLAPPPLSPLGGAPT